MLSNPDIMIRILVYNLALCIFIKRAAAEFGCPKPVPCNANDPYSRIDGQCNNLNNPLWGATGRVFRRLLAPVYDDGVGSPRGSSRSMPTPRQVSAKMAASQPHKNSTELSLMHMIVGQSIAHDISHTPDHTDDIQCCTSDFLFANNPDPRCLPLDVEDDEFFEQYGAECLNLGRSKEASPACELPNREQVSLHTVYLDCSHIYGNSVEDNIKLRTLKDGQLKTDENVEVPPGANCPVLNTKECPFSQLPLETVNGKDKLVSGDPARVDENPALVSIHAMFNRLHNEFAMNFSKNGLDDETAFQEARRLVYAIFQHIIYDEFLPLLLDSDTIRVLKLSDDDPHVYNPAIDATSSNAFPTSCFRYGHSQIQDSFQLDNRLIHLKNSFFIPNITYQSGQHPTQFMYGVSAQVGAEVDLFLVSAVRNFLKAKPGDNFGSDLLARNILRGREHGLDSYNGWREYCGLKRFNSFEELIDVMPAFAVNAFREIYLDINDIDMYAAGLAEYPRGNGIIGPTFSCIIAQQFHNLKYGDRFFYTSTVQPKKFSNDVLIEIKKISFASLICRYTNTDKIPQHALRRRTNASGNNPDLLCENTLISGSIKDLKLKVLLDILPDLTGI